MKSSALKSLALRFCESVTTASTCTRLTSMRIAVRLCSCANAAVTIVLYQQTGNRNSNSYHAGNYTHHREHFLLRDEVERSQHQPDFEQPFAEIETQRAIL